MKYLKTYEYWVEGAEKTVEKIELKDLESMINKHCKDFNWKDEPIYRGMHENSGFQLHDVMLFKPSLTERTSENTRNYYTWLIDNSPDYKDYPKRSKSLICANDLGTAETFGDDEAWRVIPFDGAKIGVCSDIDLWASFPHIANLLSIYDLDDFNGQLQELYSAVFNPIDEVLEENKWFGGPKNEKEFFKNLQYLLDELQIIKKEKGLQTIKDNVKYVNYKGEMIYVSKNSNYLNMNFVNNLPLTIEGIIGLFDPNKNGIKLMDYKEWAKNAPSDVEVWLDSDSILVHSNIADILEERYIKGEDVYKDIEKILDI